MSASPAVTTTVVTTHPASPARPRGKAALAPEPYLQKITTSHGDNGDDGDRDHSPGDNQRDTTSSDENTCEAGPNGMIADTMTTINTHPQHHEMMTTQRDT